VSAPSDKAPGASDTSPAVSDTGPGQVGPDEAMAAILAARRGWDEACARSGPDDGRSDAAWAMAAELDKLIAAEPVSRAMGGIVAAATLWYRETVTATRAWDSGDDQAEEAASERENAAAYKILHAVDAYLEAEKAARIQAGLMTADDIQRIEGLEPGGFLSGDVSDCTVEEVVQTIEEIRTASDVTHLREVNAALVEALREAQSALALMVSPDAIRQSSVLHAYAQATAAEAKARAALAAAEPRSEGGRG
jgi:hypothetical protein